MEGETGKDVVPAKENLPVADEGRPSEREAQRQTDIDEDHELARDSIRHILVKSRETLDDAVGVAFQSQEPRAYEVVSGLVKVISDSAKDILEVHQRKDALEAMSAVDDKEKNNDEPQKFLLTADLSQLFDGMAKAALEQRDKQVIDWKEGQISENDDEAEDGEFIPPSFDGGPR